MGYDPSPETRPQPPLNLRTVMRSTSLTAVYPEAGLGTSLALLYVACGLAGEAGETANKVKKIVRDDNGEVQAQRRDQIAKELGGVLWYWLRLCSELNLDPYEIIADNMKLLTARAADGTLRGDDQSDGSRLSVWAQRNPALAKAAELNPGMEIYDGSTLRVTRHDPEYEQWQRTAVADLAALRREMQMAEQGFVPEGAGIPPFITDQNRAATPEEIARWEAEGGQCTPK